MAGSLFLLYSLSRRRFSDTVRGNLFFIPTGLALITLLFILFYISFTSSLFTHPHPTAHFHLHPHSWNHQQQRQRSMGVFAPPPASNPTVRAPLEDPSALSPVPDSSTRLVDQNANQPVDFQPSIYLQTGSNGNQVNDNEVFHDKDIFLENYKEMNRTFKIYIYPHQQADPFANVLLPVDFEPGGNYASESYFKKVLTESHFVTKDPSKADLFFLPFSIARLRHDPRVGSDGIENFIRDYIFNVSHNYPYWNRTGGSDHFYVACHSIGRSAVNNLKEVKLNVIQVVCSSSYFQSAYVTHKDASLPQIWPRKGDPTSHARSKREKLAFFAGAINSPVREKLIQAWENDSEISVHYGHLKTPYAEGLLGSKFCLHVKGFEVNTARVGDALYYGCVPIIIANHYDLPFADIFNWKSFSVIVATLDIPLLKKILKGISFNEYTTLQNNVLKVRKHFQWHILPVDYDAFYMVMYELWLRRSSVRVPLRNLVHVSSV